MSFSSNLSSTRFSHFFVKMQADIYVYLWNVCNLELLDTYTVSTLFDKNIATLHTYVEI